MDENLPGYVLNALESDERRHVEQSLASDPDAAAQMEALRQVLAPLATDADEPEPPPRLVLNTLARIAEYSCTHLPAAPKPRLYEGGDEPLPRRRFRRPDLLV